MVTRAAALVFTAIAVGGCVAQSAVPIRPDVWRVNTRGQGPLGTEYALTQTLKDAAGLTLDSGYAYFTVADGDSDPRRANLLGIAAGAQVRTIAYGAALPVPPGAEARAAEEPVVKTSVIVQMYRRNEPRPRNAYEATQVLFGYSLENER